MIGGKKGLGGFSVGGSETIVEGSRSCDRKCRVGLLYPCNHTTNSIVNNKLNSIVNNKLNYKINSSEAGNIVQK